MINIREENLEKLVMEFLEYRSQPQIISGRRVPRLAERSLRAYKTDARDFLDFLKETCTPLEQVSNETVLKYLLNDELGPATSYRRSASLAGEKGFLGFLKRKKLIGSDINFHDIRLAAPQKYSYSYSHKAFTSEGVYTYLLDAIRNSASNQYTSARDILAASFLFRTGIKLEEMTALNVGDVNLDNQNSLFSAEVKGKHKKREVGISYAGLPEETEIDSYLSLHNQFLTGFNISPSTLSPLFLNKDGKRISDRSIRGRLNLSGNNTGLAHISPKTLRRSYIISLRGQGKSRREIAEAIGLAPYYYETC